MGILEMDLPPIPFFASTQTENYSLERIKFLESVGMQRVILARELSLNQIKVIRANTSVELECFIHGALCVSFSGQCYFSEAITGRSANRGQCAQPCRMRYDLTDQTSKIIIKDKNLLSLKDLNLSEYISQLIDSGICSFKIEGRLKDSSYVKNITAFYRKLLDKTLAEKPLHQRSSAGKTGFNFTPKPEKSFNRSFTSYYINNLKRNNVASIQTEKSIGEQIGKIKSVAKNYIVIDTKEKLHNGDGICFFVNDYLYGTNINKAEKDKIFLNRMEHVETGIMVYRNSDIEFDKFLVSNRIKRKIGIKFFVNISGVELSLTGEDEEGYKFTTRAAISCTHSNPESVRNKLSNQLKKTGESIFEVTGIEIPAGMDTNIPICEINKLRRDVTSALEKLRLSNYRRAEIITTPNDFPYPGISVDYKANVTNSKAKQFYARHGVKFIAEGFELTGERKGKEIMTTKYCIRYEIGMCPVIDKNNSSAPLFLVNNNKKYRIEFHCKDCQMKIILC